MSSENQTMTRTKIHIVDDEQDICYFLSGNFTKRGFDTSYSHNLNDAEKHLLVDTPALLLLDNHLPDGRGIDAVSKLKNLYPDLKIIMITAHDSAHDRIKAYGNGIDFFLSKPFTISNVNEIVDEIIKS